MTKTNQEKQHQDHFNLKVPYCCSLFTTFILIMTVISRDCHFLAITPKNTN
ncbi:hypothetical protein [Staphylococcus aureus]|uniref:hypothetical protein n=1 Tax=Staphylococcus aureus TaxID=1280 RepID=UPI001C7CA453|nr:hypothetical protein [Staphylococcus aureus]QZA64775.1 hypothetical protein KSF82_13305 [Staphylococcus aureus]